MTPYSETPQALDEPLIHETGRKCVCDPDTWAHRPSPSPICAAYKQVDEYDESMCFNCDHDKGCHAPAKPLPAVDPLASGELTIILTPDAQCIATSKEEGGVHSACFVHVGIGDGGFSIGGDTTAMRSLAHMLLHAIGDACPECGASK